MRVVSEAAEAGRVNPVALVQLDLSKAFDRVHRKYLSALLHYFGVGETIEGWVSICYRDNYTRLLVNGVPGAAINIEHSVKQGCPLSPALFALYLEPLCRSLLADDKIRGDVLGDAQTKALSYADDVALAYSSREEMTRALHHMQVFESFLVAELNWKKTLGAWLGDWDTKSDTFHRISLYCTVDSCLGVTLNLRASATNRWGGRVSLLGCKIFPWRQRHIGWVTRSYVWQE